MARDRVTTLPAGDIATRNAAGQALVEAARDNPDIWVLTADVMHSTGTKPFAQAYPDRFINVGIAEQTMVGVAAGLATCGKTPFAATFAFAASMRACEQVRSDVAYPNLNVKIYATHSGLALAKGGTTHHATEDIGIMRAIANVTVLVPADARESAKAVKAAAETFGPMYIRLRRGADPVVYGEDFDYQIGRANELRAGSDVTLIGCGRTVAECVLAANLLDDEGIEARVLDMHTVKPLDVDAIQRAVEETELVVTVEDHNILTGLGGAVAEVMAEMATSVRLKRLGLPDIYAGIGPEEGLLKQHGLTSAGIAATVSSMLA